LAGEDWNSLETSWKSGIDYPKFQIIKFKKYQRIEPLKKYTRRKAKQNNH